MSIEKRRESRRLYAKTHPEKIAAKAKRRYQRNVAASRAAKKAERQRRSDAGRCLECMASRLSDSRFCALHREANRVRSLLGHYKRSQRTPPPELLARLDAIQSGRPPWG